MRLAELIKSVSNLKAKGALNAEICDVCCVASNVTKGSCFVALSGKKTHGKVFVDDAIKRGALAVLSSEVIELPKGVSLLIADDARRTMADLSARIWNEPSKNLKLVGVTGTSGKTTVTYLLESVFSAAGMKCGVIGTVEHRFDGKRLEAHNTTPESCDLQRYLCDMVDMGIKVCAMEVSSHALELSRVLNCHFDCAIFTNLSQEHLDFHGNMKNYFEAKKRLFIEGLSKSIKDQKFVVVNIDDEFGRNIAASVDERVVSYGFDPAADVCCRGFDYKDGKMVLFFKTPLGSLELKSHLIGKHNAYNITAAIAAGIGFSISLSALIKGIESLKSVPGRMEPVLNKKGVLAFVDYAHKPGALKNLLEVASQLKTHSYRRVILVFGCGGDRDREKRPVMGEMAARFADHVIVTNDNPRTEDPTVIIDEIILGIKKVKRKGFSFEVREDRKKAIERSVELARPGDIILVVGKGHEKYQLIGDKKIGFDDREILERCMKHEA